VTENSVYNYTLQHKIFCRQIMWI